MGDSPLPYANSAAKEMGTNRRNFMAFMPILAGLR
jgi:hypothetical protein